ncbi:uncharacterized protein FIESC28_01052 [Fusarium coffeatum]|uniref:Uncharacterized protein n=1 Tax=Fusarium coffeatum TaxID=231269 RepID=A0A366SA18_9HYPO|nr:uncharacterized protein FIESC28_01052 [Fusarium coffeatum]RBR26161.1 hypothetical protein FIESC28_01052 [Fusarium coffeatum]
MGDLVEKMVDYVWPPPREFKKEPGGKKNPNNWLKWGFTIYRTYYGEESDEAWQMLLYSLRHQTKLAFGGFEDMKDANQDDVQRLRDLFRLDVREDASVLDGLDVRGLRKFCNDEKNKLIHIDDQGWRHIKTTLWPPEDEAMAEYVFDFVLLADEAVLRDIAGGEFIVKAVSMRWREGYSAFGWMRIPTGYLLDLWMILMFNDDHTERALSFRGPESELDYHIWPGDMALADTGACSEMEGSEKDSVPAVKDYCGGIWTNTWYRVGVLEPNKCPAEDNCDYNAANRSSKA